MSVIALAALITILAVLVAWFVQSAREDSDLAEHLAWLAQLHQPGPIAWPDDKPVVARTATTVPADPPRREPALR